MDARPERGQVDAWLRAFRNLRPAQVAEAYLMGALWWYSAGVLYPASALKRTASRSSAHPSESRPWGSRAGGSALISRCGTPSRSV